MQEAWSNEISNTQTWRNDLSGKFELYKNKGGEFRFRLKASNGQIILVSEGYKQ
jgi:hypothetical protein